MWDGISYVHAGRSPIIAEGRTETRLVIMNVGPSAVTVTGWPVTKPSDGTEKDFQQDIYPGNSVSLSACLIRAEFREKPYFGGPAFAVVAWRVLK
jgi:hypothetical protein